MAHELRTRSVSVRGEPEDNYDFTLDLQAFIVVVPRIRGGDAVAGKDDLSPHRRVRTQIEREKILARPKCEFAPARPVPQQQGVVGGHRDSGHEFELLEITPVRSSWLHAILLQQRGNILRCTLIPFGAGTTAFQFVGGQIADYRLQIPCT